MIRRGVNLSLRMATLLAKGGLIFFLATKFSPEDVGRYGLIAGLSTYWIFLYGFDFYAFASRFYIGGSEAEVLYAIKNQAAVTFIFYLIFCPLGFFVMYGQIPLLHIAILGVVISVLDHLTLEAQRAYVFMLRPLFSSLIFFFRAGAWAILCVALLISGTQSVSLEFVLLLWALGLVSALAIALYPARRHFQKFLCIPIDMNWIWKGVLIATPLLIGTIALRGLFSLDRVLVANLGQAQLLASFVVYASVASAIQSAADAGVIAFKQPLIVAAARTSDLGSAVGIARRMAIESILVTSTLGIVAYFTVYFGCLYLNKISYLDNMLLLAQLLFGNVIYAAGLAPHTILYGFKRDRANISMNVIGFLVFLVVFYSVVGVDRVHAIGWALISAFIVIGVGKLFYVISLLRKHAVIG